MCLNEIESIQELFFNLNDVETRSLKAYLVDRINEIQTQATVIVVNNVRFSPELKLELKEILSKCIDGTRIISSESIVPRPRSQSSTSRRIDGKLKLGVRYIKILIISFSDFVKITDERLLHLVENNTSWTGDKVPFYLTEINRNKVSS